MAYSSITIISVPYHVGMYGERVGEGPLRLLRHGLDQQVAKIAPTHYSDISHVDDFEGEIGKTFEVIRRVSKAVSQAVAANSFPLILAGNCNASVAAAAGLSSSHPDLGVIWLDAHDDLETPSTHENGYLDGMAASIMTGSSWHKLASTVPGHVPLALKNVVYGGLRVVASDQQRVIQEAGVDAVWGSTTKMVDFEAELCALLQRRKLGSAHVHLDLDVLDESLGRVNEYPSAGGFLAEDLKKVMAMIPTQVQPTSLVICGFNPRLEGGNTIARLAVQAARCFVSNLEKNGHLVPKFGN
ncbi:arginase [Akanthomyces lecanii RCEF 1005]|uniref:Arginase n=1 Tax=Akanthomyces lecanii RCEF 1005 TaxID=1081108 RepID=A0A168IZY4_CORDF|nr:arginase [Akanthomyces lecanii RCEF 1005]